ncbi:uncharacterized protein LOC101854428 [Aplysia californica]|uniref:Uncharacterized protein LOC101854428 n=1 Tax=Aplysia californica TaxID=6500 RepID=A0ABM1VXQ4_APLCA|nr:uncharacterized protein LOC101854428 [Aplysia californica]XP_012941311.1 uncharacterized protein LOC101854428 [Aplysia californica]XP_012941312.1 uncharacterized protein LOC101854428 [Aplysia californica]XP_035827197.1 uncharacterized protein LOC101854428 [Aplysia californica]
MDIPTLSHSKDESENISTHDLLEMRTRLNEELKQLTVAQSAASHDSNGGDESETDLSQRVNELKEQLLEESNRCSTNELLLKRVQMGQTLCEELFTNGTDPSDSGCATRCLQELELTSQLKRILKETSDLEDKLVQQKMANLKLKKENAFMMQKLKDSRKSHEKVSSEISTSPEYKQLKSELEKKCVAVQISKHIAQLIIMNSGADLTEDSDMMELLLKCGKPLLL